MKKLDIASGLFWLMAAVYVCLHSMKLGFGTIRNPGAGFLFFWAGVALGIFSVIVLASALVEKGKGPQGQKGPFENVHWFKTVLIIASLVVYAAVMEWLGFLISTVLLIGFLLRTIETKKWFVVASVALASAFLSYVLFEILIHARLPKGFLGI